MIYFIQDSTTTHIKVGHSARPWVRLSEIQVTCPGELTMLALEPGDEAREVELHAMFAAAHVRGEWFQATPVLLDYVGRLPPPERPRRGKTWGDTDLRDIDLVPLVGISAPFLSLIRRGLRQPSLPVALKIHKITGVPLEAMVVEGVP